MHQGRVNRLAVADKIADLKGKAKTELQLSGRHAQVGPKALEAMKAGVYGPEGEKFVQNIEASQQELKAIGPAKGDLELGW